MPSKICDDKTVYVMKENLVSLTGDSFVVTDEEGNTKFTVDGTASFEEKKTLKDDEDCALYVLSESNFQLREKQYIADAESGETVFTLRKKGMLFDRNTTLVFAGDDDEGDPVYTIAGGFMEKEYDIKKADSEEVVCEVDRRPLSNIVTDKDTYAISVEAGQDAALMIAFAVCIDEIYRDD